MSQYTDFSTGMKKVGESMSAVISAEVTANAIRAKEQQGK